jgi:hypothetical protein
MSGLNLSLNFKANSKNADKLLQIASHTLAAEAAQKNQHKCMTFFIYYKYLIIKNFNNFL